MYQISHVILEKSYIYPHKRGSNSKTPLKQWKKPKWVSRFSVYIRVQIAGNRLFHCK